MGCGGSKKKPEVKENPADAINRPSVVMDPRARNQGPLDPWEQPHPLRSPYPQGKVAVDKLLAEDVNIAVEDIPIQREIVAEQLVGKLVKESEIKR